MPKNIKIKKNEENPETLEVLADSIIRIADGFEKLLKGGIKLEGIAWLIKNMPGVRNVGYNDVMLVLENIPRLRGYWINKT